MYFKFSLRHNPALNRSDAYWRLVESYRNNDDRVCHHTLLNIGFLKEEVSIDRLNLIRRKLVERQNNRTNKMFRQTETEDAVVNQFTNEWWNRLISEKRIDTGEDDHRPTTRHRGDGCGHCNGRKFDGVERK